jgi:hypothetical protein
VSEAFHRIADRGCPCLLLDSNPDFYALNLSKSLYEPRSTLTNRGFMLPHLNKEQQTPGLIVRDIDESILPTELAQIGRQDEISSVPTCSLK